MGLQEPKKQKFFLETQFVDLYEDNVRHRVVFPLISVLLISYITFSFLSSGTEELSLPTRIDVFIDPSSEMKIMLNSPMDRASRLVISDQRTNSMANAEVDIELTSIETAEREGKPYCDTRSRISTAGSLEHLRLYDVCFPKFLHTKQTSDDTGNVVYSSFSLQTAPEGIYTLLFKSGNITSKRMSIYFETSAARIEILTPQVYTAKYGVPIMEKIRFRILNFQNEPMKGKQVIAFSWPEPTMSSTEYSPYYIQANKFALLSNQYSSLSDANGIAVITNLTILASTSKYIYLLFSVDAEVIIPWQKEDNTTFPLPSEVPRLRSPIVMEEEGNQKMSIKVVTSPSGTAEEGKNFAVQPVLSLSYSLTGNPVMGVSCIAYITGEEDNIYPRGFKFSLIRSQSNYLLRPIPGTWSSDLTQPIITNLISPSVSNELGQIAFTNLAFSQSGNLGATSKKFTYKIRCGSASTSNIEIIINTSIAKVSLTVETNNYFYFDRSSLIHYENVLSIKDKQGRGVAGKILDNVTVLNEDYSEVPTAVIHEMGKSLYGVVSDSDGLLQIFLQVKYMVDKSVRLSFSVDGINHVTGIMNIINPYKNGNVCNAIRISKKFYSVKEEETFNITVDPISETGSNMLSLVLKLKLITNSSCYQSVTAIPTNLANFTGSSVEYTFFDLTSPKYFTPISFPHAFNGTYFLEIEPVFQGFCDIYCVQNCRLENPIRVHVKSNQEEIISKNMSSSEPFITQIRRNEAQYVSYQFYTSDSEIATGFSLIPSLEIYHVPPQYYHILRVQDASYFFTYSPQVSTQADSNGVINVNFILRPRFPGKWGIGFSFNGKYGDPISFYSDAPDSALTIMTDEHDENANYSTWLRNPYKLELNLTVVNETSEGFILTAIPEGLTSDVSGINNLMVTSGEATYKDNLLYTSYRGFHQTATSSSGLAQFLNLTMIDVSNSYGCFKYRYVFGEPEYLISQVVGPKKICFVHNFSFELEPDYSTVISGRQQMSQPIAVKFNVSSSSLQNMTMMGFKMLPAYLNSELLPNNSKKYSAQKWTSGYTCSIYNKSGSGLSSDDCTFQLVNFNVSFLTTYHVIFNNFNWLKASRDEKVKFEISNLLSTQGSQFSNTIYFVGKPTFLEIITQPPSSLEIQEPFRVVIKARLNDGTPIQYVPVTVNISTDINSNVSVNKIINTFGSSKNKLEEISNIFSSSLVALYDKECYASTDQNGLAKFYLRFTSGKSGTYKLIFDAQGIKSDFTTNIILTNNVNQVKISLPESIVLTITEGEEMNQHKFPAEFNVYILDSNGSLIKNKTKNIVPYIINSERVDNAYNLVMKNQGDKTKISLNNISLGYNTYSEDTAKELLIKLWKVITNRGEVIGSSHVFIPTVSATIKSVVETATSYYITDLTVSRLEKGTYYILFVVDGIESALSNPFTIEINKDKPYWLTSVVEPILICGIMLLILVVNSWRGNYVFPVIAIFLCSLEIYLVSEIKHGEIYEIVSYIVLSILILVLIGMIVFQFIQGKRANFFNLKKEVFEQYTTQLLRRLSLEEEKKSEVKMESTERLDKEGEQQYLKYHKRSIKDKVCSILSPFGFDFLRNQPVLDAFFFPQRFIASFLLGILAFFFTVLTLISFFQYVISKMDNLKNEISKALGSLLNNSVYQTQSIFDYDPSDEDLNPFLSILDYVKKHLNLIQNSLKISYIISIILSSLFLVASLIFFIHTFKRKVLNLRYKNKQIYKKIDIAKASYFPGCFINNCVLGFIIFNVLFILVFTVLCHSLLWEFVFENIWIILIILLCAVIVVILVIIVDLLMFGSWMCSASKSITHIIEAVSFFLDLIGGVAGSIARVIVGFVGILIAQIRLDKPMIANWLLKFFYIDAGNESFLAMVKLHNQFNNPIAQTFVQQMLQASRQKKTINEQTAFERKNFQFERENRPTRIRFTFKIISQM